MAGLAVSNSEHQLNGYILKVLSATPNSFSLEKLERKGYDDTMFYISFSVN